jgi:hypothetical protein
MIDEAKRQRKLKGKRTCAGDVARRNKRIGTREKGKHRSCTKERNSISSKFAEEGIKEGVWRWRASA